MIHPSMRARIRLHTRADVLTGRYAKGPAPTHRLVAAGRNPGTVLGMTAKLWFGLGTVVAGIIGAGVWLWTPDRSRSALEQKYLARDTDMVDIAGTRLHVRDSGPQQAATVILLHGLGSSLHTWDGWAPALEQNFRVIRLDLPGSGLSPPDPTADYSDGRSIELLLALMEQTVLSDPEPG